MNGNRNESSFLPIEMTRKPQISVHILQGRRQRRRELNVHLRFHQHQRTDVVDDALVDSKEVLVRYLVRRLQLPLYDRQHAVDRLQHASQPIIYRSHRSFRLHEIGNASITRSSWLMIISSSDWKNVELIRLMNSISIDRYGSMLNAKKISVARVKIWRSAEPNPYQPAIDQKIAFSPEQRNQISDGRIQFERHKLSHQSMIHPCYVPRLRKEGNEHIHFRLLIELLPFWMKFTS